MPIGKNTKVFKNLWLPPLRLMTTTKNNTWVSLIEKVELISIYYNNSSKMYFFLSWVLALVLCTSISRVEWRPDALFVGGSKWWTQCVGDLIFLIWSWDSRSITKSYLSNSSDASLYAYDSSIGLITFRTIFSSLAIRSFWVWVSSVNQAGLAYVTVGLRVKDNLYDV